MKRGFLLRVRAEERKVAVMRGDAQPKIDTSSSSVVSDSSTQHPKGLNPDKRKLASSNLNKKEKDDLVYFKESDPRIGQAGFTTDVIITSLPQPIPDGESQCVWITNASTKAAILNTPGYPARIPKPPRGDLYEVKLTPDMGQGLFAKCNISTGELIFAERPLIVGFRQLLSTAHTGLEYLLEDAIARLPLKSQTDFKALYNTYMRYGHPLEITMTNGFPIPNLYDSSDKGTTYAAIYKVGSRINHSCIPNVHYNFNPKSFSVQFFALRDIKTGEQLFHSYCRANKSLEERKAKLALHGFECECRVCANATPESDQLRKNFETQITNFKTLALKQPLDVKQDILEQALKLEKDMVKEELDVTLDFGSLLIFIGWVYAKLGNMGECKRYRLLGSEIQNCYLKYQE